MLFGSPAPVLPWEDVEHAIEHAIHFLPAQGPISVFVHHNTLHALEDRSFAEALHEASQIYKAEPYWSDAQYRTEFDRGRITLADLENVLKDELGEQASGEIALGVDRFQFYRAILSPALVVAPRGELEWLISRDQDLKSFESDPLWKTCLDRAEKVSEQELERYFQLDHAVLRPRDAILDATGFDSDNLVHEHLIRFLSNQLDQGFSQWQLTLKKEGMLAAFLELYGKMSSFQLGDLKHLKEILQTEVSQHNSPQRSIQFSLAAMGVTHDDLGEMIRSTLLALSGWAGMIWQLESNAEWTPKPLPKGALLEYLAVRLLLDRAVLSNEALIKTARRSSPHRNDTLADCRFQLAYVLFQIAGRLGWSDSGWSKLIASDWTNILSETLKLSPLAVRRLLHLAFERHYSDRLLSSIGQIAGFNSADDVDASGDTTEAALETNHVSANKSLATFQLVTCIDDREESMRRNVEEVDSDAETFGFAGFFGVTMYFRSATDAHYVPLCPVGLKPQHYVEELSDTKLEQSQERRDATRRLLGKATHSVHLSSRSLWAGTAASLVGAFAGVPLIARVLAPRATSKTKRLVSKMVHLPSQTDLALEHLPDSKDEKKSRSHRRTPKRAGASELKQGFDVPEMVAIVAKLLTDIGIKRFSRLVLILGHGSSSLNNPHESAYNCGACGGGRGGPNARAFARMANDPRVRLALSEIGILIPDDCYFVGGYHNTCNDSVEFADVESLPVTHKTDFLHAKNVIENARSRNALERSRRFTTIPVESTFEEALRLVEARSEDLSEARPEYNHATNAACFVGRRSRIKGLFMDRRCFVMSYDPLQDSQDAKHLARILSAVVPVCAGISLEYYFSTVDNRVFGCGSKLPHNIVSLLGVMDGAASDLRTGLSQQMVEIHEPMRMQFVFECTPEAILSVMSQNAYIDKMIRYEWVHLSLLSPSSPEIVTWKKGSFVPFVPPGRDLPVAGSSYDWYRGSRGHLGFARIGGSDASITSSSSKLGRGRSNPLNAQAGVDAE